MREMTSRQRVQAALNFKEPDRVPLILGGCTSTTIMLSAYEAVKKHLGITAGAPSFMSEALQVVHVEESVARALKIDMRLVEERSPGELNFHDKANDILTDEWGVKWRRPPGGLYYDICNAPLKDATLADLETYPWPDPDHPERLVGIPERAQDLYDHSPYALYAHLPGNNIFEYAWYMRGIEQFLLDLLDDKAFAHGLLAKITAIQKRRTANFLARTGRYIDILRTSDDLGTQRSLFISPGLYREMIKPYQRDYFALIKEQSRAKILYHCCGAIAPLIPDLIEVGVDILNPVQVSCAGMDTKELKARFGDRLSFCGGIDTQRVLPNGTPADVEAEVRRRLADLAPGGGYLLAAVHNIQSDVSAENIVRMYRSGEKYGRYPIEG